MGNDENKEQNKIITLNNNNIKINNNDIIINKNQNHNKQHLEKNICVSYEENFKIKEKLLIINNESKEIKNLNKEHDKNILEKEKIKESKNIKEEKFIEIPKYFNKSKSKNLDKFINKPLSTIINLDDNKIKQQLIQESNEINTNNPYNITNKINPIMIFDIENLKNSDINIKYPLNKIFNKKTKEKNKNSNNNIKYINQKQKIGNCYEINNNTEKNISPNKINVSDLLNKEILNKNSNIDLNNNNSKIEKIIKTKEYKTPKDIISDEDENLKMTPEDNEINIKEIENLMKNVTPEENNYDKEVEKMRECKNKNKKKKNKIPHIKAKIKQAKKIFNPKLLDDLNLNENNIIPTLEKLELLDILLLYGEKSGKNKKEERNKINRKEEIKKEKKQVYLTYRNLREKLQEINTNLNRILDKIDSE